MCDELELHVLSADTFGTVEVLVESVRAEFRRVKSGRDKRAYVEALGAQCCVAIGNGRTTG